MKALHIIQVQTVSPEGGKLLIFILIVLLIFVGIYRTVKGQIKRPHIKNKIKFNIPKIKWKNPLLNIPLGLQVKIKPDNISNPAFIHLSIVNKNKKNVSVENPVIRFRKGIKTKAYKIKTVNSSNVYPLHLSANEVYDLKVSLQMFYNHEPKLQKFTSVKIEFKYNGDHKKSSNPIYLTSNLFRKTRK